MNLIIPLITLAYKNVCIICNKIYIYMLDRLRLNGLLLEGKARSLVVKKKKRRFFAIIFTIPLVSRAKLNFR